MRRAAAERRQVAPKNGDDYKKFTVGKDPLEKEADIDVLRPHGGDEQKSYLKMLRRLLKEKTREVLSKKPKQSSTKSAPVKLMVCAGILKKSLRGIL